jgi:hypothetical protein
MRARRPLDRLCRSISPEVRSLLRFVEPVEACPNVLGARILDPRGRARRVLWPSSTPASCVSCALCTRPGILERCVRSVPVVKVALDQLDAGVKSDFAAPASGLPVKAANSNPLPELTRQGAALGAVTPVISSATAAEPPESIFSRSCSWLVTLRTYSRDFNPGAARCNPRQ